MDFGIVFVLSFCCLVEGEQKQQFALQYIGNEVSEEEQVKRDYCESKYCLLDANDLFLAASQNESVRPCEDFKEFALGTFIKYKAINDRDSHSGFSSDVYNNYFQRMRKVVAAPVDGKDTNVTRAVKRFYKRCVSANYITQDSLGQLRDFLRSYGLKFYPEINDSTFDLRRFIGEQPEIVLNHLLRHYFSRVDYRGNYGFLEMNQFQFLNKNEWFASFQDILYEVNQVYLNSTHSQKFKKEFIKISRKQEEFYDRLEKIFKDKPKEPRVELFTIKQLNELTSTNIDWLNIINKMLITKVDENEVISIVDPNITRRVAALIAVTDRKTLADFIVYNFLGVNAPFFILYTFNVWTHSIAGVKKGRERWIQCVSALLYNGAPALEFLYLLKHKDEALEKSMEKFAYESLEFAIEKFKQVAIRSNEVVDNVIKRLRAIKFVVGYPKEIFNEQTIDDFYGHLITQDVNFVAIANRNIVNHENILREPIFSKRRKLEELTSNFDPGFKYFPYDDVFYIPLMYLHYPFYHQDRPRFFNTATLTNLIYEALHIGFIDYLRDEWNETNLFSNEMQVSYEFYEHWLDSGGTELQLGANRLTNRQLYWVATARHFYAKVHPSRVNSSPEFSAFADEKEDLHWRVFKNEGFRKAFSCQTKMEINQH